MKVVKRKNSNNDILLFIPQTFYNSVFRSLLSFIVSNSKNLCPICKRKLIDHSELQDKICEMITIKQFANNSPGFDVQFRPFFED